MRAAGGAGESLIQMLAKLILSLMLLGCLAAAESSVNEKPLQVLPKEIRRGEVVVSPDHSRVAWIAREELVISVVVDGKKQQGYDWIVNGAVGFTGDSKRVVYAARK